MMGVPVALGVVLAFAGVTFPVENPRISLPFGAGNGAHYSPALRHNGLDIVPTGGGFGRAVLAPIDATVHMVYYSASAGWVIVLEAVAPATFWATAMMGDVHTVHAGQTFYLGLKHHQKVHVEVGQRVRSGQVIATVGSTGSTSTGPHVHVELRLDKWFGGFRLNPLDFFIAFIPELRAHLYARGWRGG